MNDGPTTFQTVLFTVWTMLQVIGVLATAAMIGKPRKPITAGHAVSSMVWAFIWIVLFWVAFML